MMFNTDFKLCGIGAPIRIFLADVAKMPNTEAIILDYFQVAHALGAIAGNISATYSIEIRSCNAQEGIMGYMVYGDSKTEVFDELEMAVEFAAVIAKERARKEVEKRGAKDTITFSCPVSVNSIGTIFSNIPNNVQLVQKGLFLI